jgi:hypothetical protein
MIGRWRGPTERDLLIEAAMTAWRPRTPDGRILGHPAWHDLAGEDRERLHHETLRSRIVEQAIDPRGVSSTARAVLARIRAARSR